MYIEDTCGELWSRFVSDGIVCAVNHSELWQWTTWSSKLLTVGDYYVIKITFIKTSASVRPFKKIIQRKSILMYSFFIIHGPC